MCNFGSFESFDNYIVTIVTNDNHGHDGNDAKNPTKASIKFANEWTPHPKIGVEGIDEHQWSLRKHDSGIRNGQIDYILYGEKNLIKMKDYDLKLNITYKHVGRGSQAFGRQKDVDDKTISE